MSKTYWESISMITFVETDAGERYHVHTTGLSANRYSIWVSNEVKPDIFNIASGEYKTLDELKTIHLNVCKELENYI